MPRNRPIPPTAFVLLLTIALGVPSLGSGAPQVAGDRRITFDEVLGGEVRYGGRLPRGRFDDTGARVAVGDSWTDVRTGEPAAPPEGNGDEGAITRREVAAALPAGIEIGRAWRERLVARDGAELLLPLEQGFVHARAGEAAVWIPLEGDRELVSLSPAGGRAAWVEDGNLFAIELPSGERRAITEGGSEDLLHGKLDWVYQEEVYGRGTFRAHWWSPDGAHLAFLRLDESKVPEFRIVDHEPARQRVETMRYPKAGEPNPGVAVGLFSFERGETTWVDLSRYGAPEEILVVRVGWTPGGSRLLIQVQDRVQSWLELCMFIVYSGELRPLRREQSVGWTNVNGESRFLEDASFLWLSEETGFRHIRRVRFAPMVLTPVRGSRPEQFATSEAITAGDWQVDRILHVDEARGEVWFTGSIHTPVESHAYRVSLDGGVITQLTRDPGSHSITIAPDGEHFLDRFTSHRDPGELRLCDRDGRILRVLAEAEGPDPALAFSPPELLRIPARDGRLLDAMLWRPVPFDPARAHPVWLPTYSGPDAPSVRDSWDSDPWKQFLCQQGIAVLEVNVRSASGRGQVDTAECARRLGVVEIRDLEDAVAAIVAEPWADANRVGITGWSYGGTMAAFALTHSQAFALGIAGAGVYDWRLYDTIYTERYMDTPQANPDGYAASSVIAAAGDLHGHLLLVHGADDDNVHLQNTMQLALALQRAGKHFEMMVYPTAMHGIRDGRQRRHLRTLEWATIREHLLGAPPAAEAAESNFEIPAHGPR